MGISSTVRDEGRGKQNNRTSSTSGSGGSLLQSGTLCGGLDFLSLRG